MRKTSFLVLSLLMVLFLASCQINVAEPPFKARFHNMLYTDIHIWVDGYGFRVIPPNETVTFSINRSDQCYHYEAETHGTDAYGEQIGLVVKWERTRDISGDSYTTYLITYPDLFFLKMRNTGYHDLHPLYVNYGMIDETIDDIMQHQDPGRLAGYAHRLYLLAARGAFLFPLDRKPVHHTHKRLQKRR